MKPLLNSKGVCQLLGISAATLSRMVASKTIPFVLISVGKRKQMVRFVEEEVERWIVTRSRGPRRSKGRLLMVDGVVDIGREVAQVVEMSNEPQVQQTGS